MNNPMRFVDPWGLFAEFYIPGEIDGGGGSRNIVPPRVAAALGITPPPPPRQPSSNPIVAFGQGVVTGGVDYVRSVVHAVTNPVQTAVTIKQGIHNDPVGFFIETAFFNPMNPATHIRGFYQGYQAAGFYGMGQHYGAHLAEGAMFVAGYYAAKAVGYVSSKVTAPPKDPGHPFNPNTRTVQVGVDPNTLFVNFNAIHSAKLKAAMARIKAEGMYGIIEVFRDGRVINGNHRVWIGQRLGIPVDVRIR